MSRPAKIFAWFIAAIAALFAVIAIAFLFLFDANDFKADVELAVLKETGRELVIDGDVSLHIFPWLAVEIGESRLGNAPGFGDEPFAAFDSVKLSVQFMPLLARREVVVGTAAIDGLFLNFEVRGDGSDNWSDLAARSEAQEAPVDAADAAAKTGEAGGTLAVSGFTISDATINYTDSGNTVSVSDADFTIDGVVSEGALLQVGAIAFEALVSGLTDIPTIVTFDTDGFVVDNAARLATIETLGLSVLGINMRAEIEPIYFTDSITPVAALEIEAFSPRSVMTQLGIEPFETADPSALSEVSVTATALVGENDIRLEEVSAKLDDTTFTGAIRLPMAADGRVRANLSGDAIDLNRYMAPASDEELAQETDTPPIEIPVDAIRLVNAEGEFRIALVQIANLELENVTLGLDANGGKLRMHPVAADLYGGGYRGDIRVDASGDKAALSFNETVDGVDLAKLASALFDAQNVTGSIAGNFKLGGRGNDLNEIRSTLGGTMSFELQDGAYEGTDVWHELRTARALLKQETPPEATLPARTQFTSVSASGEVTNGVLRNNDFVAELPFMRMTGAGTVDFVSATVDYGLDARIFSKPELMGGATPEEIEDFTKTVVPLKMTGPLSSPEVAPDLEKLLRKQVEDRVKEELEDKLKDLFKR